MYETELTLTIEVEYNFLKGSRGHRDKFGAPEEPDTPDEVEITAVYVGKTDILKELDDSEIEELEEEIYRQEDHDKDCDE